MPGYKTHVALGVAFAAPAGLMAAAAVAPDDSLAMAAAALGALLGSVDPDLDLEFSYARRLFITLGSLSVLAVLGEVEWIRPLAPIPLFALAFVVPPLARHRGAWHWILSPIVVPVAFVAVFASTAAVIGFALGHTAGYLVHAGADAVVTGVKRWLARRRRDDRRRRRRR